MSIIYRYMLKRFANTMVFALLALCVIFILINLMENLDDFLDAKTPIPIIIKYYIYFLPDILKLLTPVSVLISALFTVGNLSNLNEITAMKTGGLSIYKIMIPFVVFCSLLSVFQIYFNGWIVPHANEKKEAISRRYLDSNDGKAIENFYYRDAPNCNVMIAYYNADLQTARGISIDSFSGGTLKPRLVKQIAAEKMTPDARVKSLWHLETVTVRNATSKGIASSRLATMDTKLNITSEQIEKMQKSTDMMTFDEYREYIDFLQSGGKDVTKLEVEYYGNYAFPFADLIVVLFAVPFASVKKKNGLAVQIAAAMMVAFIYLIATELGKSFGISLHFNPQLSGWFTNILFALFGITVILKTKT